MYHRIVRLFVLFASALFLLLTSNTTAFSAAPSPIQQDTPVNVPLDADALEQFWQELYPSAGLIGTANNTNVYTSELLAKATPDECFNGIGADESADPVPDCPNGQPKVNEAYVWGMTPYEETIWFGTAPNVHCLVMGAYLGSTAPAVTDSYTCEFGAGPNPTLNVNAPAIGDWRSPKLYIYDNAAKELVDVSPNGSTGYIRDTRFVSTTLGIRSAATFGDYVFFAGPALLPSGSINIFLYDAANRAYLGSYNLTGYNNIRKWLVVDDVLYTAVGKASGGAVLRYTGDPSSATLADRFQFEEVGLLDADGAELALHDGRIFVNTWPSGLGSVVAGLYMSPVVPDGGLTNADAGGWVKVFSYDEYEPDPVVA